MSEIRTMHVTANEIISAAVWNAANRATAREIQNMQGWMAEHETDGGGGVVGGFAVTEGAARRSDVSRGAALVYVGSTAAPGSKWNHVYSEATLQATHDAHTGNPRIDLLTLSWAAAPDTSVVLGQVGGVPAAFDTQRGCQATLNITKGTAAGSPVAPSVPAGHFLLYHVWVPATSGALVYYDKRVYLPGPSNRNVDDPVAFQGRVSSSPSFLGDAIAELLEVAGRAGADGETGFASQIGYDMVQDWPMVSRGRTASGEVDAVFYPMMAYADRKWWETFPIFGGHSNYSSGDGVSDITVTYDPLVDGLKLEKGGDTDAVDLFVAVPLPTQGRKLEIVGAKLDYDYSEAFTGSTSAVEVRVFADSASASAVEVAEHDLDALGLSAGRVSEDMTITPRMLGNQDRVWLSILVSRSGAGITNAGVLHIFGVSLQFKEGRG